ncbi:hypothetical protein HMPREF1989_01260 [Porphyromonas gingivalis F0566]|nr:hypothetical protein HMPREF1989_01260 [Porphyromonas gingivalis F0566]
MIYKKDGIVYSGSVFLSFLCVSLFVRFASPDEKGGLPKSYRAVACKAGPLPFAGKWMA